VRTTSTVFELLFTKILKTLLLTGEERDGIIFSKLADFCCVSLYDFQPIFCCIGVSGRFGVKSKGSGKESGTTLLLLAIYHDAFAGQQQKHFLQGTEWLQEVVL